MTSKTRLEVEYETFEKYNYWSYLFKEIRQRDEQQSTELSFTEAKLALNSKFNRYRNILPYDHSRVILKDLGSNVDYINANYVECKLANRKYILSQGPLDNTCEHFWQMIWEQNTKGIIMLNKLYEKDVLKCEMYYPNKDEKNAKTELEFSRFRLKFISERNFNEYSIRTIECENLSSQTKREILHFHFKNWPDFGEPSDPKNFLKFVQECCSKEYDIYNKDLYGPPVVHCSAGVGRSGTYALIDSIIQMINTNIDAPINVCQLLLDFRRFRMGLVQTHQQLKFVYVSIIEYLKKNETEKSDDKKNEQIIESSPSKHPREIANTNQEDDNHNSSAKRIKLSSNENDENNQVIDEIKENTPVKQQKSEDGMIQESHIELIDNIENIEANEKEIEIEIQDELKQQNDHNLSDSQIEFRTSQDQNESLEKMNKTV